MIFNASERKGILVILFLITGTIIVPRYLLPKEHHLFLLPVPSEVEIDSLTSGNDSVKKSHLPIRHKTRETNMPVELNTADSVTLIKIRGIGPFYASKILRYRHRLGGFYSVSQLKELKMTYFNIDSSAHLFIVNPALIRQTDLDTMSFKAILRHPYLEYEDVQLIFIAKRKYGHISYSVLEEHKILTEHKLKKIQPYFK